MIRPTFDAIVCDLDGVVYLGDQAIDGAVDAIAELRRRGTRFLFATNNSRPTVDDYVVKLRRFGIEASRDDVITSSVVTAEELATRGYAGRTALVVGGEGIRAELTRAGIEIAAEDAHDADLVVVGWDPTFTYATMKRAALAARNGARLVATNADAALPAPDGLWPGAGAILASITTAAGVDAEIMGKPHRPMMEAVARRLGTARRVAAVGDRPETDLVGARAQGWTTILVLTGATRAEDVHTVSPAPDLVLGSLAELIQ